MNLDDVKKQAQKELDEEYFKEAVEKYKIKLKTKRSIWDKVFPYKIMLIKKEKL